jgi:ATP adenylyltransferase
MPVTADTKVIVEAIEDSYDRLHDAFREQAGSEVAETGAVRVEL